MLQLAKAMANSRAIRGAGKAAGSSGMSISSCATIAWKTFFPSRGLEENIRQRAGWHLWFKRFSSRNLFRLTKRFHETQWRRHLSSIVPPGSCRTINKQDHIHVLQATWFLCKAWMTSKTIQDCEVYGRFRQILDGSAKKQVSAFVQWRYRWKTRPQKSPAKTDL